MSQPAPHPGKTDTAPAGEALPPPPFLLTTRQGGARWDRDTTSAGDRWGCRLERFLTNPAEEPDPEKWRTELAFRLADGAF